MTKIMPFLFLPILAFSKNVSDFEGEFVKKHSVYDTAENKTTPNVEDFIKIQTVDKTKANVLIETFSKNSNSCQLVGEAKLQGDVLVFKSSVNKKLNRGKHASCTLKITVSQNATGEKTVKVVDTDDNCRLRYCGMIAELGGEFQQKSVLVQDKK